MSEKIKAFECRYFQNVRGVIFLKYLNIAFRYYPAMAVYSSYIALFTRAI